MARLFKHKDVEDYFVTFDYATKDPAELAKIVKLYEAGKVIVLENARLDFDRDFIGSVELPNEDPFKKFKSVRFVKEYFESGAAHGFMNRLRQRPPSNQMAASLLERVFRGDKQRLRHFAEQIRSVNQQLVAIVNRLFPSYRYLTMPLTWRLAETLNENLHFDTYKEDLPDHHLRLFVNLDSTQRIWHTSMTLETALQEHLGLLDPEFVRTATAGRILHDLNLAIFGGWDVAGRDGRPRHISFFGPGEIWLVDSRKISHQILYGRRAISTDFAVDVASMDDPSTHYYAVVERYRKARAS
jgi:hypothetical protein